jgi:hypothetical protein
LGQKRSQRNLGVDLSGLENAHYGVYGNKTEEKESPSFRKHTTESKNKIKQKSPKLMPMDQIVIINNHEYMDRLFPPTYKVRNSIKKDGMFF